MMLDIRVYLFIVSIIDRYIIMSAMPLMTSSSFSTFFLNQAASINASFLHNSNKLTKMSKKEFNYLILICLGIHCLLSSLIYLSNFKLYSRYQYY